jgi:hypothetical protein
MRCWITALQSIPAKTKQAGAFYGSGLGSLKIETNSGDQIVPPY